MSLLSLRSKPGAPCTLLMLTCQHRAPATTRASSQALPPPVVQHLQHFQTNPVPLHTRHRTLPSACSCRCSQESVCQPAGVKVQGMSGVRGLTCAPDLLAGLPQGSHTRPPSNVFCCRLQAGSLTAESMERCLCLKPSTSCKGCPCWQAQQGLCSMLLDATMHAAPEW